MGDFCLPVKEIIADSQPHTFMFVAFVLGQRIGSIEARPSDIAAFRKSLARFKSWQGLFLYGQIIVVHLPLLTGDCRIMERLRVTFLGPAASFSHQVCQNSISLMLE